MNTEKTLGQRLQDLVAQCTYIHADPEKKYSQKMKDDVRTIVNKLLDFVIAQTDPRHIKILIQEALDKRLNKKMDGLRKANLERLSSE